MSYLLFNVGDEQLLCRGYRILDFLVLDQVYHLQALESED